MSQENLQTEQQLNQLTETVRGLSQIVAQQNQRLEQLEQNKPVSTSATEAPPMPPTIATPNQQIKSQPARDSLETKIAEKPIKTAEPTPAVKQTKNLESEIGMKWFGRIGVIALIVGISFFLKYAFDNNWIGVTGRVILGIISGLVLLGLGEFFRKNHPNYAQILNGGGIAVLYLSTYAAFGFYHLIAQTPALIFMAIVTLTAGFLSIRYGGAGLAGLGIFGGFLTPVVLSVGLNNAPALFSYITILNIGVLGISFFRQWRGLNLLGLLGTGVIFIQWHAEFYTPAQLCITEIFMTIYFLIYAFAIIAHNIFKKNKTNWADAALMILNASAFFGISYHLLNPIYKPFLGLFAVVIAAFYFVLAWIAYNRNPSDRYMAFFLSGVSVAFLTLAAPIQFNGHWITIAWAIESSILVFLGFKLSNYSFRIFGWIALLLTTIRLLVFDTRISNGQNYILIFNQRFLTFIIGIGAASFIYYLYLSHHEKLDPTKEKGVKWIALLILNIFLFWGLNTETIAFFNQQTKNLERTAISAPTCQEEIFRGPGQKIPSPYCQREKEIYKKNLEGKAAQIKIIKNRQRVALSTLWAIYAILLLVIGITTKNRVLRLAGMGLFGITIFKVFLYDLWSLGTLYRIISSITLGLVLLSASFAYNKYKERLKEIL